LNLAADLLSTGTEQVPSCILCGAGTAQDDVEWARLLALVKPYGVKQCAACNLRWLSPRPDANGLKVIYSDAHYFASGGSTDYSAMIGHRLAHFQDRIARHVTRGMRVLDYGAATGEFVKLARDAGAYADGVEYSADARAKAAANGIDLYAPGDRLPAPYDLIHMNHVFEHMPDPRSHLAYCRTLLRPGGLVIIEVPNQFLNLTDRLRRLSGKGGRQAGLDAFSLHHTYFFSPRNLQQICEAERFVTESCRTIVSPQEHRMSMLRKAIEAVSTVSSRLFKTGDAIEWVGRS
jgi:2-polyprenyl-3-methyl-5-hydroxy-6-metoxy-1,4-benzoquinol methylase